MLVFNFPYPENRWNSISMDVMRYYVKRCIALPGDTLEIREGRYKVRGCGERLGKEVGTCGTIRHCSGYISLR
ncbi:S26 family signal peptidase [Bacteroides xylanisolvens]|uniref:S26 family signal peptidase n=1 Tax=Bacteroides xylanisolvens TaxID=371601 RepID=UPI0022E8CBA7|nr:S26 family signal peptidase [Bacteroides xylanisolvens]